MIVKRLLGETMKSFGDQEFFEDFYWSNFKLGDIVWLDDYYGEVGEDVCLFGTFFSADKTKIVIRVFKDVDERIIRRSGIENVENITELSSYWQTYLIWRCNMKQ